MASDQVVPYVEVLDTCRVLHHLSATRCLRVSDIESIGKRQQGETAFQSRVGGRVLGHYLDHNVRTPGCFQQILELTAHNLLSTDYAAQGSLVQRDP